jgi:hypothetical protein
LFNGLEKNFDSMHGSLQMVTEPYDGTGYCVGRMGDRTGRSDQHGERLLRASASRLGGARWLHTGHRLDCRREERALRDRKSQFGCKERYMGSNYYLRRIRQQFHGIATGDNTDNPENDESMNGEAAEEAAQ